MPPTDQPTNRTATLRIIGSTAAITLVVALVVVELATIGRWRNAATAARGAPQAMAVPSVGDTQEPAAVPLPAPAREALDRANAAYRAKKYAEALTGYRAAAAAAAPGEPAPYFGIYMAATALHNAPLADSAMTVIRASGSDGGDMLTDSSLRDLHSRGSTIPAGHPTIPNRTMR
jgi:hypothetical protein